MIQARIIKDSISINGNRLISIETKAPKFLDAEIEKHRMISSNSSSSRAIPVNKTLEMKPYIPEDVRLNERGMQGYTSLDEEEYKQWAKEVETLYNLVSSYVAVWDDRHNIHKQHLNRFLEPFKLQTKIMTANKEVWDYFLSLRDSPDADPNVQDLARKIKSAINGSKPVELSYTEWHLPYVDSTSHKDAYISAARCARTSYVTHEGKETTPDEDKNLADFLLSARHLTPFEHQATPYSPFDSSCRSTEYKVYVKEAHVYSGNFKEWLQYRQSLEFISK